MARTMQIAAHDDAAADAARATAPWIVTYTDMMALLLTFFVMLMSFSTLEQDEAMVIFGAFGADRGGVIEGETRSSVVDPPRRDRMTAVHALRGAVRPHSRPEEALLENLVEMGRRLDDKHIEVDFSAAPDGLAITFGDGAAFTADSAELAADLRTSLAELGGVLVHYAHTVVVEGHADGASEPPSLALDRALAAAAALAETGGVAPERIQVSAGRGDGATRLAPRRPPERRVDVRLLALSSARERALEREFSGLREAGPSRKETR